MLNDKDLLKIEEATNDLKKLETILNDTNKFRTQSNSIYYEISSKPQYFFYINLIKVKNGLCGNTPFEQISNYLLRRKIMASLQEAVKMYILKIANNTQENNTGI